MIKDTAASCHAAARSLLSRLGHGWVDPCFHWTRWRMGRAGEKSLWMNDHAKTTSCPWPGRNLNSSRFIRSRPVWWRAQGRLDQPRPLHVDIGLHDRSAESTYRAEDHVHVSLAVQDEQGGGPRLHEPFHVPDEIVRDTHPGRD